MIGIDIVEINRIQDNAPELLNKVFTKEEIKYCKKYDKAWVHLAARFAAKEAIFKACNEAYDYKKISILDNKEVLVGDYHVFISMSHSENYAIAVAIAYDIGFVKGFIK